METQQSKSMEPVMTQRGGREIQEREDLCIIIAGSLFCTAESNTTL